MREISIVYPSFTFEIKCAKEVPKNKREGDTILKINLTLINAKLKILLCSL